MLDRAHVIPRSDSLRLDLLALKLASDVSVDCAESVHLGQLFSLDKADLELLELFLDLCGHHDLVSGRVWSRLIVQLHLLIARPLHRNGYLQIARDIREILPLRIEECDPLVLDSVLVLEVDRRHVELIRANHLISEDALVHYLDGDCLHFDFTGML